MARSILFILVALMCLCVFTSGGCGSQSKGTAVMAEKARALRPGDYVGRRYEAETSIGGVTGDAAYANLQEQVTPTRPEADPARTDRLVVYNGVMNVVVDRISDSLRQIQNAAGRMGGYMQKMSSNSITLKIPADRFEDAIAEVEKLGEVTRKDIEGTDVTDQMRDLKIRLDNAEQVRERLAALLERAEKVEDALKIERELERVTETIELLKGKIAHLENSVAFCTLTVRFNSPVPQEDITARTPFRWVHDLGSGLTVSVPVRPREESSFWHHPLFALPQGYLRYYEDENRTSAMSAEGVIIDVHRQKNYEGGDGGFWASLVRRVLVEQKVFNIKEQVNVRLKRGSDAVLLIGSKQIGSKQFGYLAALAAGKKHVYVFEAWGPQEEFAKDRDKLEKAIESMRAR
jgi:hypothetical protein